MGDMVDMVHPDIEWDVEAEEAAMRKAQALSKRDPEGSALLIAQLIAAKKTREKHGIELQYAPVEYRPARLYGFMARECGWTPQEIDAMHYLTFFSVVREVNQRIREEQEAQKG